jgi:hypothetical protein
MCLLAKRSRGRNDPNTRWTIYGSTSPSSPRGAVAVDLSLQQYPGRSEGRSADRLDIRYFARGSSEQSFSPIWRLCRGCISRATHTYFQQPIQHMGRRFGNVGNEGVHHDALVDASMLLTETTTYSGAAYPFRLIGIPHIRELLVRRDNTCEHVREKHPSGEGRRERVARKGSGGRVSRIDDALRSSAGPTTNTVASFPSGLSGQSRCPRKAPASRLSGEQSGFLRCATSYPDLRGTGRADGGGHPVGD